MWPNELFSSLSDNGTIGGRGKKFLLGPSEWTVMLLLLAFPSYQTCNIGQMRVGTKILPTFSINENHITLLAREFFAGCLAYTFVATWAKEHV